MLEGKKYEIRGVVPLYLHNGQMVDPLNPYSKAMKKVTSKRTKTDEDHEAMARIEWEGGFYFDGDAPATPEDIPTEYRGNIVMPTHCIEAMLRNAAAKTKGGVTKKDFASAVFVEGDFLPLDCDADPSDLNELFALGKFSTRVPVKVGQQRVMRTRPFFTRWGLKFEVRYVTDLANESEIDEIVETAGIQVGLCDWRPKFGRFEVVSASQS